MRRGRTVLSRTAAMLARLQSAAELYERYGRARHAQQCRRRIAELEAELVLLRAVDHDLRVQAGRRAN